MPLPLFAKYWLRLGCLTDAVRRGNGFLLIFKSYFSIFEIIFSKRKGWMRGGRLLGDREGGMRGVLVDR